MTEWHLLLKYKMSIKCYQKIPKTVHLKIDMGVAHRYCTTKIMRDDT